MIYEVYVENKLFCKFLTEDEAREFCIESAANKVELLKRKVYYPILRKKYGVEKITDIPAKTRYQYWDEQRKKYLKENYYIKVIDTTPTDEELESFKKRAKEYYEEKRKNSAKSKIRL